MEMILHTGIGHPSLLWVLVASIISFAIGLAIGKVSKYSKSANEEIENQRTES